MSLPYQDVPGWTPVLAGLVMEPRRIIAKVSGVKTAIKVDAKTYLDISGANMTTSGYELAQFKLDFTVWTSEGQSYLWYLIGVLRPKLTPLPDKPKATDVIPRGIMAISVYHPTLEVHGIRNALITSMLGPEWDMDRKRFTLQCDCMQWAPPPKPTKKPETQQPKARDISATGVTGKAPIVGGAAGVPRKPAPSEDIVGDVFKDAKPSKLSGEQ